MARSRRADGGSGRRSPCNSLLQGLFGRAAEAFDGPPRELVRRERPQRALEVSVGEDLDVIGAIPAGAVERVEQAWEVRGAVAGQDAVARRARRVAEVGDVDAGNAG